jgi:hypothetical protein
MEEGPENGKESSHFARAIGIEWNRFITAFIDVLFLRRSCYLIPTL